MTTAQKTPVERGAPSAFAYSSSEDDMGASSSSTASRSSKDNPRIVVMTRGKDSELDKNDGDMSSSSSSPPLSYCGTTTGRSRKKTTVPGKKSRTRTKMLDGHLLAQDHQRQLLKRSSSLPADVTYYADHLKLFYEELPDGLTSSDEKVDPDTDICPNQSKVDGQQVHDPQSAVSDKGGDTQQIVDDVETSQNQLQPSDVMGQISGHSAKDQQDTVSNDQYPETGELQSVVIECPSSDSSDSHPCSDNGSKPSPDDIDHQSSVANHIQPGHDERKLSSEIGNNQHGTSFSPLSAEVVVVNKDMADSHCQESSARKTLEADDTLGLSCHKQDSSDQNGSNLQDEGNKSTSILSLNDRESSSTSGYQTTDTDREPAKGSTSSSPSAISDSSAINSTPSVSNSDPSAPISDPSASNSEGSHQDIYAEHSGDVSTSSEDDKRAKETNRQSTSMPFFLPTPYLNPQYPIFYVNNRGRGSFVHGPLREDYATVPDYFVPQSNSTFLGCKLNRRPENQQGNYAYRHTGHANGQAYLPDTAGARYDRQYGRPWTHYNPRGSSPYLRRGRGGLILRGRGGFRAGRGGGSGGRTRVGECRFPHYNTFSRRSRSRHGVNNFSRRRMQDQNSRDRQEQLDRNRAYGQARNGDWESPNNRFSRGRTQFRTDEAAYRHRSAPPAHNMRMANGMPYVRQRHRSLSRSGRHSDRPRDAPHPQTDQVRWQYSPRVSKYQLNKQELYIPQQNYASPQQNYVSPQQNYASPQQNYASPQRIYGPNVCRWSRETGLAWPYHRQNRGGDAYNRQGFHAGRTGQQGPTSGRARQQQGFYFDQENGHSSNQTDCEPLSSENGVSTERTEAANPDGQDAVQKTITVITQETGPQNGSQMPAQVERETEKATQVDDMGRQDTDRDAFIHQHSSDTPGHSEQPGMPHGREGQYNASLYGQWQKNRQAYRRKQRDGPNASYWRGTNGYVSPRYPGRQRAFQWEPQSPKHSQQRICRQQNGASEIRHPERYFDYERQGVNRAILSNGVNVTHWNHNNSGEFPLCRNGGQVRMDGSPGFLAGDNLQIDFVRKVMHVLHDQHVNHAQSDQILQTLMKRHLPSEAGHSLTNIMRHLEATQAQTPNRQGRVMLPCTVQENNSDQSRYLPNVRHQRKCRFDDGNQNNVSFELVTQANTNHAGNYMHCAVSPPHAQQTLQANGHDTLPETFPNSPLHGYSQPDGFPGNRRQFHTKENQKWRRSMRESQPQYVYYLDNQDKKTGARLDLQSESDENQKVSWNYQNANQFSDMNTNQQGLYAAGGFNQIQTVLQHSHSGQDNSRQSSVDQAGGGAALGSARQARLVMHDGMSNYEVLKSPQNLNHKPVLAMNEVQVNGAHTRSASPGFDKNGPQNALDKVNGNVGLEANVPDGRLQMPLMSNQPVQMGMGNFLPSVTPLQTPMLPVQLQTVNTPLLQTVNTPMFHPLQTPFIQTMNVPYPQQNMFQFPSPVPYIPVGTPAQVCPAPNVFQFPDLAAGQQPFPMEVNQAQQHEAQAAAESRGFAGNQPLVQFPPNHTSAMPSNQGHPHPLDNAPQMGDVNGNDC